MKTETSPNTLIDIPNIVIPSPSHFPLDVFEIISPGIVNPVVIPNKAPLMTITIERFSTNTEIVVNIGIIVRVDAQNTLESSQRGRYCFTRDMTDLRPPSKSNGYVVINETDVATQAAYALE